MQYSELILDGDGDVWVLDAGYEDSADPYYEHNELGSERLSTLISKYSPVRRLVVGDKIESPIIPTHLMAQFNMRDVGNVVQGKVKSFDENTQMYVLEVRIDRDKLRRYE